MSVSSHLLLCVYQSLLRKFSESTSCSSIFALPSSKWLEGDLTKRIDTRQLFSHSLSSSQLLFGWWPPERREQKEIKQKMKMTTSDFTFVLLSKYDCNTMIENDINIPITKIVLGSMSNCLVRRYVVTYVMMQLMFNFHN